MRVVFTACYILLPFSDKINLIEQAVKLNKNTKHVIYSYNFSVEFVFKYDVFLG